MAPKPLARIALWTISDIEPIMNELEATEDIIYLSRNTHAVRHTFRGVAGNHADVLVTSDFLQPKHPCTRMCLELSLKEGKYSGNQRKRYTLRRFPDGQTRNLEHVGVSTSRVSQTLTVTCYSGETFQAHTYPVLRYNLDGYHLARIVMWHWNRYYKVPIPNLDEARQLADQWQADHLDEASRWTLSEANRSASRFLYAHARSLGWHKLTIQERTKLGLHYPWVCDADYATAQSKYRDRFRLGVSEHTLYISNPSE